jgi:tRNA threonylcarbamoyladenosine biosynthesis protein TsaE
MIPFVYEARDLSQTETLGAALAEVLPPGTTVGLCGTLGAGKTRLVQAVAVAAGVEPGRATSPTFVLVQEYHGRRTIYHVDAYRVRDEDEFLDLGPDEWFESDAVVLVEWADRVAGSLPPERIDVRIEVTGHSARRFEIAGRGPRCEEVVSQLARRLAGGEAKLPERAFRDAASNRE